MATPLQEVYDIFLSKVKDYSFIELNKEGLLDDMFLKNIKSATVRFTNCDKDLTIDANSKSFVSNLSFDEIEILSEIMLLLHVSKSTVDIKNREQIMTEPEFKAYSQANHLKELLSLKSSKDSDVSALLNAYSLKRGLEDFS